MVHQAWCCFREVPYCFSRSSVKFWGYTAKQINRIGRSRTTTPVWIHQWLLNAAKTWSSIEGVPYCFSSSCVKFQGHTGYKKIFDFDPNWAFLECNSSLNSLEALKQHRRGALLFFQGHLSDSNVTRENIAYFAPYWGLRNVSPVWIHRWLWNDAQSLM